MCYLNAPIESFYAQIIRYGTVFFFPVCRGGSVHAGLVCSVIGEGNFMFYAAVTLPQTLLQPRNQSLTPKFHTISLNYGRE